MSEDLIYLEKRAREFLEAWPNPPEGLRPVYSRFMDAKMIWADPNVDSDGKSFPGTLRLTEDGQRLKDLVAGQSYNGYSLRDVLGCCSLGQDTAAFQALFKYELPGMPARREPRSAKLRDLLDPPFSSTLREGLKRLDRQLLRLATITTPARK